MSDIHKISNADLRRRVFALASRIRLDYRRDVGPTGHIRAWPSFKGGRVVAQLLTMADPAIRVAESAYAAEVAVTDVIRTGELRDEIKEATGLNMYALVDMTDPNSTDGDALAGKTILFPYGRAE